MKGFSSIALVCGIILVASSTSSACNGFKSRLNSIANCGKYESVIKVNPNANATIDDKCNLYGSGCISSAQDITEGKTRIIIKLNGVQLQKIDRDLCDGVLKSRIPDIKNILELFGLPDECPIKAGEVCASEDKKININRFKDFLALARGKVEILIKMLHGNAGKSCVKVDFEIYR